MTQNETVNQMNVSPQLLNTSRFPELANLQSVNIVQDVECIDCLFPMCTQNRYNIINPLNNQKLYDFKEESGLLERLCCFGCRGFVMKINNAGGSTVYVNIEGKKGCSLPCYAGFGCGHPSIKASFLSPQNQYFGSAKMDYKSCVCSLCKHIILIRDANNNSRYHIKPNCYCIGCNTSCCAKCCDILYNIFEENQVVGTVSKLSCSGFFTFCPKGDNYTINFPANANPEEKFMIIIGTILIDYLSFPM